MTTEANHVQVEQNTANIGEIKQAMSRIENCLQNLTNTIKIGVPSGMGEQQGASSGSFVRQHHVQFGTLNANTNGYLPPTRLSRVEFPRFDGVDFRGWSYRCRQFFAVDGTPNEQRIRLASIHLEGKALKWHLTFMKRHEDDISWEDYFAQMEARFTDIKHLNPMVQLKQLQQANMTVDEYIEAFDDLLTDVDIPEGVAMSFFLGGLRADIQSAVDAFKLSSLASLMQMAKI